MLSPKAIWDLATRWSLGGAATARELFADVLTGVEIDALTDSAARSERAPTRLVDEASGDRISVPANVPRTAVLGEPRYDLGASLGVGGVGKVISARDREIGRIVALKTLKHEAASPSVIERFVTEAKVTAQLEHPNVVPVYDMGTLPNGQPFYTMRVTKRQSLQDVLGNAELRKQWPLFRLMGAFVQVSRALAYAHSRGVLPRDIKPENILLGDFGEVYLADWGNAKTVACPEGSDPLELVNAPRDPHAQPSGLSGTPGYIAPEQIRGERAIVDHRADIFALGVVLYEMLTGEHPFDAATVLAVILATQTREPKRPTEIVPNCPLVLEDLCLAMLQKDPSKRPQSAETVAAEAQAYLEGAKEKARRREEARRLCALAEVPIQRTRELGVEYERLLAEARDALKEIKGHEPIEAKRPGWELEDAAAAVHRDQARAMAEAIELYTKALAYDPQLSEARAGLADLYWSRAVDAENKRASAQQVYYETLVTEFDVGQYAAQLRADATLSIETSLPGAIAVAHKYVERDRVLVKGEPRYLGLSPLREARVAPGSYLVVVKHAGCQDARVPVLLKRGELTKLSLNLYTHAEIGEGFVYVPGGPFVAGGDPVAAESLPRAAHEVADFAIARYPVTFREYCAFLDDLERVDPSLARKRAPHDLRGSEGLRRAQGRARPVGAGAGDHRGRRARDVPDRAGPPLERARRAGRLVRRGRVLRVAQRARRHLGAPADRGRVGEGGARRRWARVPVGRSLRPDVLPHARVAAVHAAGRARGHVPDRLLAVRRARHGRRRARVDGRRARREIVGRRARRGRTVRRRRARHVADARDPLRQLERDRRVLPRGEPLALPVARPRHRPRLPRRAIARPRDRPAALKSRQTGTDRRSRRRRRGGCAASVRPGARAST